MLTDLLLGKKDLCNHLKCECVSNLRFHAGLPTLLHWEGAFSLQVYKISRITTSPPWTVVKATWIKSAVTKLYISKSRGRKVCISYFLLVTFFSWHQSCIIWRVQNTHVWLGHLLGKTLWLHASSVSQSKDLWSVSECVKLLVYTFCIIHIFLTQKRIRFIRGVLMPYSMGNIMQVGMLGSKIIKGVLLDETLR